MPFFLRKISIRRWDSLPWLPTGDLQADSLKDLKTENNCLSVWWVEDDLSNLDQVVAALAANCDDVANFDYSLFDQNLISVDNIEAKRIKGASLDENANSSWHRDLAEMSGFKLVRLAKSIFTGSTKKRILEKQVLKLIAKAVASGNIDKASLKEKVKEKVDRLRSNRGITQQ